MNTTSVVAVLAALLVVVGAVAFLQNNNEEESVVPASALPPAEHEGDRNETMIRFGAAGFSPSSATVQHGDTVRFVNESSDPFWPASAVHPTHTAYPGSGIQNCGTGRELFDACSPVGPGEEWTFRFDEHGTWRYHDHLAPGMTGTIIVE